MARELGDVLHFFLDDVPRKSAPGDRSWLGPALARLEPPLSLGEELDGLPPELGPEATRTLLARDPEGLGVLVLVAEDEGTRVDLLALGLAQLEWLTRRQAARASGAGLSADAPRLLLVAERFAAPLEGASAVLDDPSRGARVRLLRTFSRARG
ncbi:MAG: hypothetical protein QNK05_01620 [Myxococcota bacterium]|nr:hypothetical protein [Myxococcota bacterium]